MVYNPIYNAPEDTLITRVHTLNELDTSSALTGQIEFSVYMEDSCLVLQHLKLAMIAPVCNLAVRMLI